MNHEQARVLLKKFRLGQCTKAELDSIDEWYDSFDDEEGLSNIHTLQSVRRSMLAEINDQIDRAETNTGENYNGKSDTKSFNFNIINWLKIAAVIVIGVGFIFYLSDRNKGIIDNDTVIAEEISDADDLPSSIFLSDGSIIYLKEDSHLVYPGMFNGNTREVTLKGEAFFKVAKDEKRPFVIYSNSLTTKVLGTSFNIKAYENSDSVEVSVVTGTVAVSVKDQSEYEGKEVVLNRNQKVIYAKKNNSLTQTKVSDSINYHAIERRKLIFNDTPLEDIVEVLNSYYNVNISISDSNLKNCHITAELSDEPLNVSLLILTKAIGAEYEMTGKKIILKGKGCGFLN